MRTMLAFVVIAALCVLHARGARAQGQPDTAAARRSLALFELELGVVEQLLEASEGVHSCRCVIRHVNVVHLERGEVLRDMLVRFAGGRIEAVGPDRGGGVPDGYREIDGRDKYLMPGLVDMHVHQLTSASQHLLHAATGVTTVRDMVGFPWLLQWREQSARDGWLAPTMHVAGPIIAAVPMGMYARVVTSEGEARHAVREQHAAGYDFIKVHNVLPKPLFLAVTDEARRLGVEVVGHVPHRVRVAEAVHEGMVTLEHLKGYVDDRTLTIATDDWVTPTRDSNVWNTPTLYAKRLFLRPDEARAWSRGIEARYVPALERERWLSEVTTPPAAGTGLFDKQREVMRRLIPVTSRFLAGTDAGGGYPFMVSGLALHEELRLLQESGLPLIETLRAATLYPARALNQEGEIGEVVAGRRADLLLLDGNPLSSLDALAQRAGVAVRGRWLDRGVIESQLKSLALTYAQTPRIAHDAALPDAAWVRGVADRVRDARRRGYVFPVHHVERIDRALQAFGYANAIPPTP